MIVDLVHEPGVAFTIRTRLVLKDDRFAIWKNNPVPNEEHAGLAERDLAVVAPDEFGALRDQQKAAP